MRTNEGFDEDRLNQLAVDPGPGSWSRHIQWASHTELTAKLNYYAVLLVVGRGEISCIYLYESMPRIFSGGNHGLTKTALDLSHSARKESTKMLY